MSKRGFSAIGLDNPKCDSNVGAVQRAAHAYQSSLVVVAGSRVNLRAATNTSKAWRSLPVIRCGDVFDCIPYDCIPVAVDLVPGAVPLPDFVHPERAFYIFGAEDATLNERILSRCEHRVMVPTRYCMNLAATVNVVLYDRMVKRQERYRGEAA